MKEDPWLAAAAAFYLLAAAGYGADLFLRRAALSCVARLAAVVAVLLHTAAIGVQCAVTQTTPFTSPADTLSATAWAVALAYLILEFALKPRPDALGAIALPAAFLCLFTGGMLPRTEAPSGADTRLLDSRLVSLHVLALLFAFSLLILASGCATLYLVQHRMLKRKWSGKWFGRLPPLERIDHLAFALVAFAFPLLTIGLTAGMITAVTRGPHGDWLYDKKVLASMVTWLVYGLYLLLYMSARWRGPRAHYLLMCGLPAALVTYFIPTQMHQFG